MRLARARIYPFPERRDAGHSFTLRDKLDLHEYGGRAERAGFRCVIGRDRDGICHDFIQLHRASEPFAAWTLVRSGRVVRVWRGAHGRDLGAFPTLREAMEAVLEASAAGPARPRPGQCPSGH